MTLKTKTIVRYALVLTFGLLLGWLIFTPRHTENEGHEHDLVPVETAEGTIWTCSMHPQIRQDEPGDCPICGMDLIPLEEEAGEANPYQLTMTAEAVKLANVQTTTIGRAMGEEGAKELILNGKIELNERKVLSQTAYFPGRIEKLFVNYEGEKVQKGQTIAQIYAPKLVSAQQELLQALKFQDSNPALVEAAKRKLKLWKLSEKQIEQIIESGEVITYWPLRADVSGIITSIELEAGDYVEEGMMLFEVADLSQLWAVFDAYESNLSWIREGDNIRFTVAAYPGREFSGKVTFIDPFIDPQTRVAEVRTEVNNAEGLLKPKMFTRGLLSSGSQKEIRENDMELVVPRSAVMWTGRRSIVYVKVPDTVVPTYEMREVVLGTSLGEAYLVEKGLQAGEEVVTNGTFTVDAAAQLSNKASMMNREVQVRENETGQASPEELQLNTPDFVNATPARFRQQLQEVIAQYLELKDALVSSEVRATQQEAGAVLSALEKVDMKLLPDDPHMYWMERLKEIEEHGEAIAKADNIDTQRRFFKPLSEGVIKSAQAFGTAEKLYVQYCPMADDDEGANWLSKSEEVRNPYYGDMMLSCGNVEDIINP
ncbi:MAG: efflux RND transporter periplasmic adaptor subunit [Cyclobacteriaceae bacterium]